MDKFAIKIISYFQICQVYWANNLVRSTTRCWNHDRRNLWSISSSDHSENQQSIFIFSILTHNVTTLWTLNLSFIQVNKIQESIEFINSKPKPLAIYAFTKDETFKRKIVSETSSGSVLFNDTLVQVMFLLPHLIFIL